MEESLTLIRLILRHLCRTMSIKELATTVCGGCSVGKNEFGVAFRVLTQIRPPLVLFVPNGNGGLWRRTDRGTRLVGCKPENRTIPIEVISEEKTEISADPIVSAPPSDSRFGTMEQLWIQTP